MKRKGANVSLCNTLAIMSNTWVSLSGKGTFTFVHLQSTSDLTNPEGDTKVVR